jgi:hypothetical protein
VRPSEIPGALSRALGRNVTVDPAVRLDAFTLLSAAPMSRDEFRDGVEAWLLLRGLVLKGGEELRIVPAPEGVRIAARGNALEDRLGNTEKALRESGGTADTDSTQASVDFAVAIAGRLSRRTVIYGPGVDPSQLLAEPRLQKRGSRPDILRFVDAALCASGVLVQEHGDKLLVVMSRRNPERPPGRSCSGTDERARRRTGRRTGRWTGLSPR